MSFKIWKNDIFSTRKLMSLKLALLSVLLFTENANAIDVQRTIFSADVVASACHVVVDADGSSGGSLTFDTYHKSIKAPVAPRYFSVRLYEVGESIPGCTAFLAGKVATLSFGNPGQLDAGGVVTRGAGDGVRIDIRAVDAEADLHSSITMSENNINYPVAFATKGTFRFQAQPIMPKDVKVGEYRGALAFVISYQ